ncbi:hypothetical protein OCU04_005692 [Sclerotinia nivalis]|uniref:Uncharacterized protein n=1 Tax=Sclerotinia nivalis TaxID=352851 RepID=A0A9X0APN2_9HELO|nr:hypothetical protein OCU04_005692 [Sclerotinia nivalis]
MRLMISAYCSCCFCSFLVPLERMLQCIAYRFCTHRDKRTKDFICFCTGTQAEYISATRDNNDNNNNSIFVTREKGKQSKTEQNKTKQNKTKQNRTKQNKTEQNKTKQNKTKQNNW